MVTVTCECGARFDSELGEIACPFCGAVQAVRTPKDTIAPSVKAPAPPEPPPEVVDSPGRRWIRAALLLVLAPLLASLRPRETVMGRLERYVEDHPRIAHEVRRGATLDEVFSMIPEGRLEGAFHRRDSRMHWAYAAVAAVIFWMLIHVAFPPGTSSPAQLWSVGLFTGTVGILLLLGLQLIAARGGPGGGIFFFLVQMIAYSYAAALNPDNGFVLSFLGFTLGVGLCEELCKAAPLVWAYRRGASLDLHGAVVWGLASGVGFGVSEGIVYASEYYHGLHGGGIYVVRFVSCVALHAAWSGTTAVLLWKRREEIEAPEFVWDWFFPVLLTIGGSVVLHGLYDTVLKKDLDWIALLVAVFSLVWFVRTYEGARRPARIAAESA
jgi:hypothetical protein